MSDLATMTGAAIGGRIRARELSAAEVFEHFRARAAAEDLNAFLTVADGPPDGDGAAELPLAGVPLAVKDLFCVEGVPTTVGSRILEGYRPPYTATCVERLAAAGAPMLGKTNMDEFAMGSSNENSGYGPVRNPWTARGCRAARAAAARPRSPAGWRRGRSAPTPAGRSASRRPCAASSG